MVRCAERRVPVGELEKAGGLSGIVLVGQTATNHVERTHFTQAQPFD